MNEGALMAQGDILLFLHADTQLPKEWDTLIEKTLHVNNAGAFSLGIDSPKRIFRIIESLVHFRTSWTKIPYGDQAHFFTSSFFKMLGCYTLIPLMEDIDIMKRVREKGEKMTLLEEKVLTSARRWEKEGIIYTTLRNCVLSLLYFLGVEPSKLLKYYPF